MYKIVTFLPALLALLFASSCRKKIKSEKGGIDLFSNVYHDASKGLNNVQNFHLSRLNYSGDIIIELVPDLAVPEITAEIFYIRDSLCYSLNQESRSTLLPQISRNKKPVPVAKKKSGALFSREWIPNYLHRKNLRDTVLFGKKYKRFEVISPTTLARYYIYPTDTLLPYTIYHHAEEDYGGRLERIDAYSRDKDMFVTLQLLPRKNWDAEAQDIFDFNEFAKGQK